MDASLTYDPTFLQTWPDENVNAANYAEKRCSCGRADPINTATGAFYFNDNDLSLPGAGTPLEVSRSYSSAAAAEAGPSATDGPLRSPQRCRSCQPRTTARERGPDHTGERFDRPIHLNVNGEYVAPPRVEATLDDSSGSWIFTRKDGSSMRFGADGDLESTSDVNGNAISIRANADGTAASLSTNDGRAIDLTGVPGASRRYLTALAEASATATTQRATSRAPRTRTATRAPTPTTTTTG